MGLVNILRSVTTTIKLFPFLYAIIFIASMFGYLLGEGFSTLLDTLFYMSFLAIALLVRLSYALKLCVWHRAQCVLTTFAADCSWDR